MHEDNTDADPVVRYLPDQLCILVKARGTGDGLDTGALYEDVRSWLNSHARTVLQRAPVDYARLPEAIQALERDLAPDALRADFGASDDLLRALPVGRGGPGEGTANGRGPWVRLARGARQGAPSRTGSESIHFYYGVEGNGRLSAENRHARSEYVRDLVNLVNRRLLTGPASDRPGEGWQVVAATPHWLAASAEGFTDGGPGARPASAPGGMWRFTFGDPRLTDLAERTTEEAIVVAVLDTSPTRAQVAAAAERFGASNPLLRRVYETVTIDGPLSIPREQFQHLDGHRPNWGPGTVLAQTGQPGDSEADGQDGFSMPDHGLFSAGIIRQLAPSAEVHLIRVLSDEGVGDLRGLVDVLQRLPDVLLKGRHDNRRLIVNLSLMADVPSSEKLLHYWLRASSESPQTMRSRQHDIKLTLDTVHRALADVVSWLADQGVLVVAAAGNDAQDGQARPEPRLPARYEEVLSVSAVQRGARGEPSDLPASYANRGDTAVMGNGIAVFGGDARLAADGPPTIDTEESPVDAIAGVFSAPQLPLGGGPNTTGWAYWAGTSFATSIATGIAANVWARDRSASPEEVIAAVRDYATPSTNAGDSDGPLDCPTILVDQVHTANPSTTRS